MHRRRLSDRWFRPVVFAFSLYLVGCAPAVTGGEATTTSGLRLGAQDSWLDAGPGLPPEEAYPAPLRERLTAAGNRPRVIAFGDSLTAGLGLSLEEAYPARLQERLTAAGYGLQVVNAGVSGETTAGGLRRLDWALEGDVRVLILALGGNDGLRGLPVEQMKDNLSRTIAAARARGAQVLLAGMEAPPNFGEAYTNEFRRVFAELAAEHEIVFVPFLLEGVAGVPTLNQPDGIHPNAEGADRVAAHVWSVLETMLHASAGRTQ